MPAAMITMRRPGEVCRIAGATLVAALVFCEFLIYYITLYSCDYPPAQEAGDNDQLRVMVLADTHLLGEQSPGLFLLNCAG